MEKGLVSSCGECVICKSRPKAEHAALCAHRGRRPRVEWGSNRHTPCGNARKCTRVIRAYGGATFQPQAERVGILSAAYKSPRAVDVALTAGLNKSVDRSVKVLGLCS